jgi:hypothetical protein
MNIAIKIWKGKKLLLRSRKQYGHALTDRSIQYLLDFPVKPWNDEYAIVLHTGELSKDGLINTYQAWLRAGRRF